VVGKTGTPSGIPTTRGARVGGGGANQAKGEMLRHRDPCLLSHVRRSGAVGCFVAGRGVESDRTIHSCADGVVVVPAKRAGSLGPVETAPM
jgi:hypothetical protein